MQGPLLCEPRTVQYWLHTRKGVEEYNKDAEAISNIRSATISESFIIWSNDCVPQ